MSLITQMEQRSIPVTDHPPTSRPQPADHDPADAGHAVELGLYGFIVTMVTNFLLLATADTSPARAPVRHVCPADRQILAAVSTQLGEDLAPITVLRSSNPHVNRPAAATGLPNFGAVTKIDGRIHVGPHTPCYRLADTLRHEYVHVLQLRAHGPNVPVDVDLEMVADTLARRWGNAYLPYIADHGEPTAEHQRQADLLDAGRGHG